jgi:alpha-D-ribose 1-methylphosphonate 5-triphosphate synthase subunit PhnG
MRMMVESPGASHAPEPTERQRWMAVLSRATAGEISAILEVHGGLPEYTVMKDAQVGTVMIEGRAGGTGQRFNLGEATTTRCVVRLRDGILGVSYALGSDRRKALLAALLDGRLQQWGPNHALMACVSALASRQQAARQCASRKAASTKVDFFTLARGDE